MSFVYDTKSEAASALRVMIATCGLSQREAARFLNVEETTIRTAITGRWKVPMGWFEELGALLDDIEDAAAELSLTLDALSDGGEFEVELTQTDEQAQAIGLPCPGVHQAIIQRVYADHRDRLLFRIRRMVDEQAA